MNTVGQRFPHIDHTRREIKTRPRITRLRRSNNSISFRCLLLLFLTLRISGRLLVCLNLFCAIALLFTVVLVGITVFLDARTFRVVPRVSKLV